MAVMMQAFDWNAPLKKQIRGEWWNFIAERVPALADAGINSLWLPPVSKTANPDLNVYALTIISISGTSTRRGQ